MNRARTVELMAVLVAATLALSACGGSGSVGQGPQLTTSSSRATASTTSPATSPGTSPATAPATGPATGQTTAPPAGPATTARPTAPPEDLSGFQTAPFHRENPVAVPPVPQVVGFRTGAHAGFDRVVFDFDGRLPGSVSVRFVDRVVQEGSGDPLPLRGNAFLQVVFGTAQAHTDSGASTLPQSRTSPGLPVLLEGALSGDFEATVGFGLGLAARTSFRVLELSGPSRVVVDVRST